MESSTYPTPPPNHGGVHACIPLSPQALETMLGTIPGMAYRCLNDTAWTLQVVTDGARTLTGYEPDDLLGNARISYADLIHPDDRQRVWDEVQAALHTHSGFELIYRIVTAAGAVRWVWEKGREVAEGGELEGFVQDITAQWETTMAYQAGEERYRTLTASSPVGIFEADNEGRITYTNPRGQQFWEMPMDELMGHGWTRRVHPDDIGPLLSGWTEALTAHRDFDFEFRLVMDDGSIRWIHGRSAPKRDAQGAVVGVVGTTEDITERRTLEEQLRRVQKMEAVGQLAGGIAHDFNNLLTVVRTSLDLALQELDRSATAARDEIDRAQAAAAGATQLVRQLLAFSRTQVLQPEVLDLNVVVADAERLLRRTIPESIALEIEADPGACSVYADPRQMEQVIVNLVVNARDAVRDVADPRIAVCTERLTITGAEGAGHSLAPGQYVALEVRDNGCGISQDTMEHIFDPFFTTKPLGEGTGLGLSTVHGIVTQSGGEVRVTSTVGVGTVVSVLLPEARSASAGRSGAPRDERTAAPAPAVAGKTILLVEDEPTVRSTARRVLERAGYRVVEAADGEEALGAWKALEASFDLLITDVRMPRLGGLELMTRVRSYRPTLPVVLMSGYAGDEQFEPAHTLGPTFLIEKPFTLDRLLAVVGEALGARAPG